MYIVLLFAFQMKKQKIKTSGRNGKKRKRELHYRKHTTKRDKQKDKWCETYPVPSYNKSLSVMEKTKKKK